jgi:hypothetical protein
MICTLIVHMPMIVLVATDIASVYIAAFFFSERIRRWSYQKRWGEVPSSNWEFDLISKEESNDFHDLAGNLARLRQVGLWRNPFEPNLRRIPENRTEPQASGTQSRRPLFRRSTVLQRRIARREGFALTGAPDSPQWQTGSRPAILQPTGGISSSYSRPVFGLGDIQDSQHA